MQPGLNLKIPDLTSNPPLSPTFPQVQIPNSEAKNSQNLKIVNTPSPIHQNYLKKESQATFNPIIFASTP